MRLHTNPQLELAFEYISFTNQSVFLTGKAGTGKTTFLQRVKTESVKRHVVVAPTGVAAINAGGMTIHSFFQLPFGPFVPGRTNDAARMRKFTGQKIRLIKSLDLLVIDEISMVRADLLDGIDEVLRRHRNPFLPFGGLQLLLIGDLHQLPPVVKDEDWDLLREHYDTPYFFGSHALQKTRPVVVELTHIFRQSDSHFINLLNKVRDNEIDEDVLDTLNSRYDPHFGEQDAYITLTTHNATAHAINAQKLEAIDKKPYTFKAKISGDFPQHAYPTDDVLELKKGAQVMFVKNDPDPEKRYYNGKIGKVTRIEDNEIHVKCPDDPDEIIVGPVDWSNVKYSLNEETKEVSEEVVGAFVQYPLKLAWAITIHKSQGLTFERVILDAQAAFAHGQVYVALSRCKSFEGIVLRSRIQSSSIRTDGRVKAYTSAAADEAPDEAQLTRSKAAYQQSLLFELFSFEPLQKDCDKLVRQLLEHEQSLRTDTGQQFQALSELLQTHLFTIADKFRPHLQYYFAQGGLPEEQEELQDRLRKAGAWFADKLHTELLPAAKNITIVTDNKQVRKAVGEALTNLQKELFLKHACFKATQDGFSATAYLRAKVEAELDFLLTPSASAPATSYRKASGNVPHPELYERLVEWRDDLAADRDVEPYVILPTKTLMELAKALPLSPKALKRIKGIGKAKLQHFGAELLAIIKDYCSKNDITPAPVEEEPPKPPKVDTKAVTFDLYRSGLTIEEIAATRGLSTSTIEGHLAHFVQAGELSILDLVTAEKVDSIIAFLADHPEMTLLSEMKARLGEDYSYGELRLVMAHAKTEAKDTVDG